MTAARRWWWVPLSIVGGVAVAAWLVAGWVTAQAREQAAEAAGIPVERVEMGDGLDVHLTGFATRAELDAAIAEVDALDSSWVVTGELSSGAADDDGAGSGSDGGGGSDEADEPAEGPDTGSDPETDPDIDEDAPTEGDIDGDTEDGSEPDAGSGPDAIEDALNELFAEEPIEFAPRSAELTPASRATLDEAAELIDASDDDGTLVVVGHTDSDGSSTRNQALSRERAEAVVTYLVDFGEVAPERLSAEGRGESELLVTPEVTLDDKARNRRIEWERLE